MRRTVSFLAVVALVLMGFSALLSPRPATAQDATPAGPPPEMPGVTFRPLGFALGVALPATGDLILVDLELEPGSVSPFDASDPTGGLVHVESGEFTVRVEGVAWPVTRGQALQEAQAAGAVDDSAAFEMIDPGTEAVLTAGDVAYIPGGVAGEVRNASDSVAKATLFLVAPGGTAGEAP